MGNIIEWPNIKEIDYKVKTNKTLSAIIKKLHNSDQIDKEYRMLYVCNNEEG